MNMQSHCEHVCKKRFQNIMAVISEKVSWSETDTKSDRWQAG